MINEPRNKKELAKEKERLKKIRTELFLNKVREDLEHKPSIPVLRYQKPEGTRKGKK
jgi:hypothetical protein